MKKQRILFQISLTIVLCILMESVSWFILRKQGQSVGFLFNMNYKNLVNEVKGFGFNEIDPLCGWAMSNEHIKKCGYEVENNCAVLRSDGKWPLEPLKILITGGSTSDIVLHKDNWPNELHKLFKDSNINAIIYAGGVGGYSSGQELLKELRDGLALNPDIHISYTGANDGSDGGYVSDYEQSFYQTAYRESFTSTILPSTVFLTKKILGFSYHDLSLKNVPAIDAFHFWQQNMNVMSSIATKNNFIFIGILQPVLGQGEYEQSNEKEIIQGNIKEQYNKYYPRAKKYISQSDTTLMDFTNIFDGKKGNVFLDDCHINTEYQPMVASKIYKLLLKRVGNNEKK